MRCIRCGHDSKHKERTNRVCPGCRGKFAFEPQDGDPVTDVLFHNAIAAVSSEGRIRWGAEHLYYEICRRKRYRPAAWTTIAACFAGGLGVLVMAWFAKGHIVPVLMGIGAIGAGVFLTARRFEPPTVVMTPATFTHLYDRWVTVHGKPKGVIERQQPRPTEKSFGKRDPAHFAERKVEPDIGFYSFDRAVICDRARTVDLLVANNFHFENNCAVLSIDGYPEGPFETVRAMLKRNPRLHVFTLHDATPEGCLLATRIAKDKAWFDGKLLVVDLGLRPRHAGPFQGLLQNSIRGTTAMEGIDATEAEWLSRYALEIAAVRPEDVLRRVFQGLQAHDKDDVSGGGTTNCGSFESGTSGSDGDGADSFG